MLAAAIARRKLLSCGSVFFRAMHGASTLPAPPDLKVLENIEDMDKARAWVEKFKGQAIPRNYVDFHFSRSSGPGGQNVNKVNTKAVVKCQLNSPWIPAWAKPELLKSSFYVSSSHCIQVSSTATRSQAQNIEDCLAKLHLAILSASKAPIKNEPSAEQKKRVEKMQALEKARRNRRRSIGVMLNGVGQIGMIIDYRFEVLVGARWSPSSQEFRAHRSS